MHVMEQDSNDRRLINCKRALSRCQSENMRLNELIKVVRGVFNAHRLKTFIDSRQEGGRTPRVIKVGEGCYSVQVEFEDGSVGDYSLDEMNNAKGDLLKKGEKRT